MSGEFLTFTIAANATSSFQKAGRYFEIIADGGSTINLTFYGPNGAINSNWNNCQSGLFLADPWTQFDVKNNSASAQTITLLLMDSGSGGSRRQPGNVRVIDQSVDKTAAGNQFFQSITMAAAAGQGSVAFVVAAVKKLVIKGISVQSSIAGSVLIGYGAGGGSVAGLAAGNLNPKLIGSAVSNALQGSQNIAGLYPTGGEFTGSGRIAGIYIPANVQTPVPLTTPFLLTPGQNLWCASNALNRDVSMVIDVEEV